MKLIEVKNLTKRFGGLVAVNNVSFFINEGEVFGLIVLENQLHSIQFQVYIKVMAETFSIMVKKSLIFLLI